jgi:hypothetical protein
MSRMPRGLVRAERRARVDVARVIVRLRNRLSRCAGSEPGASHKLRCPDCARLRCRRALVDAVDVVDALDIHDANGFGEQVRRKVHAGSVIENDRRHHARRARHDFGVDEAFLRRHDRHLRVVVHVVY